MLRGARQTRTTVETTVERRDNGVRTVVSALHRCRGTQGRPGPAPRAVQVSHPGPPRSRARAHQPSAVGAAEDADERASHLCEGAGGLEDPLQAPGWHPALDARGDGVQLADAAET